MSQNRHTLTTTVYLPSFIVSYLVPFFDRINLRLDTTWQRVLCKPNIKGLEPDIIYTKKRDRLTNEFLANSELNGELQTSGLLVGEQYCGYVLF